MDERLKEAPTDRMKNQQHSSRITDEDIKQLYAARKRKLDKDINVEPLVKRTLLKQAKVSASKKYDLAGQMTSWFQLAKGVTVSSAMALLIGLIVWNERAHKAAGSNNFEQYAQIEIHQMLTEQEAKSDALRRDYDTAYKEFLKQQQLFAFHHRDGARLSVLDKNWVMTTCNEQLIKVSPALLAMLSDLNRVDLQLISGDTVDILYALDGRIMKISKSSALIC